MHHALSGKAAFLGKTANAKLIRTGNPIQRLALLPDLETS